MEKVGYAKIDSACIQTAKDGLEWLWVDTCCIDKSNSAELSEAINSMYKWYENSVVCYALLEDDASIRSTAANVWYNFHHDRWFSRGWTLQELIAPTTVRFFDKNWSYLTSKANATSSSRLEELTGIPADVIVDPSLIQFYGVAAKMSWASGRKTTRIEDTAYSLMGLFKVNMPLLYGEGKSAFIRLQEEILKDSDDHSIFAWDFQDGHEREMFRFRGVLADDPSRFAASAFIAPGSRRSEDGLTLSARPYSMTNKGLRIHLRKVFSKKLDCFVALLDCKSGKTIQNRSSHIVMILDQAPLSPAGTFLRGTTRYLQENFAQQELKAPDGPSEIYILKNFQIRTQVQDVRGLYDHYETCLIRSESMLKSGYVIEPSCLPSGADWHDRYQMIHFPHRIQSLLARRIIAVGFHNVDRGSDCSLLLSVPRRIGDECVRILDHKIDQAANSGSLGHVYEREFLPAKKWPLGDDTYCYSKINNQFFTARVIKDEVMGRKIIIVDIGVSDKGYTEFDSEGAAVDLSVDRQIVLQGFIENREKGWVF
ncbi:HET-containing protein [Glarea lozoyensis ATCC 20868]|uniref:HET-containing protein n=1 Tax=Glarea lozoyensis (strain ATCC 20868 / MF5171) TaxID=1116229 RepID=S3CMN2_GLAL2|nr:HET-containing protein [Glarea lozoyensis ATCC 20868]EPE26469.1 HET-containing protein [Glarea lozoyensis ATCC 20868]